MTFQLPIGARLVDDTGRTMILSSSGGAADLLSVDLRTDTVLVRFEDGQDYRVARGDLAERTRHYGDAYGNPNQQETNR